jgi:hypothetical protein
MNVTQIQSTALNAASYGTETHNEGLRPLSHKTHGGLRLVSGTLPLNATTSTLSGSVVSTSR